MKRALLVFLGLAPGILICGSMNAQTRGDTYAAALDHALGRYTAALSDVPNTISYPRSINPNGTWRTVSASDWTSGFWPGTLWLLHAWTGEEFWKTAATSRQQGLASQQFNTSTHDLGFMLYNSYGQGFRLTGDTAYRDLLLQATQSLMSRYNPTVGAMRSWSWGTWAIYPNFTVIVDNMMNLELPYIASGWPGGNPAWHDMATTHAQSTASAHIRPDDTTWHAVIFNEADGAVIDKVTHQGYGDETTWARGQAWGIYGFTLAYRFTGNPAFLDSARDLADWFLTQTAFFPIPPWDFFFLNDPGPVPYDSSAAAIVASALLELSQLAPEPDRTRYDEEAIDILDALAQPPFLTSESGMATVLDHATGNWPANDEIDTGIVYADYYFIEALLRYFTRFGGGSYAHWAGTQFGFPQRDGPDTGPDNDPNRDGIPNLWHFLTKTNAAEAIAPGNRSRLPTISVPGDQDPPVIQISTTIVESHPGFVIRLEFYDTETSDWIPHPVSPTSTPANPGMQTLTFTLPSPEAAPLLMRLNAVSMAD
jgi:hypothetical protein